MSNDITNYRDSELADYFDNDEYLYEQACMSKDFSELESLANEYFIFTEEQLEELRSDFREGRWS